MATITVSDETRTLFDAEMARVGVTDADQLVQLALESFRNETVGEDYDDLDEETRAAIEAGEAEHRQGLGRPWEQVRDELRAKYIDGNGRAE